MLKFKFKKFILILSLLASMLILFSCANKNNDSKEINSIYDLNNEKCTIGVGTGSHSQVLAEKELSKAKILYFNNEALGYNAVVTKQIDGFVFDRVPIEKAIRGGMQGVRVVDDNLSEVTEVAIGLPKKPKVENEKEMLNQYLKELREDGTLDEMYNRWVYEGNEEMPYIPEVENPTRELVIGTTGVIPPFTFYKGNELCGYEIELSKRLALKFNAKISFKVYDYEGIIVAVATNDIDMAIANLNITKERAEAIDFSDVLYENKVTAMVRDSVESGSAIAKFIKNTGEGFRKTFIRENRYKLFIEGILCTLRITVLAIIFGTILGFILFLICYNSGARINGLIKTIFWLLRRIPIVVLLMVFYYIIFSKLSFNSELVAIIAFSIIFGVTVAELIINTINKI